MWNGLVMTAAVDSTDRLHLVGDSTAIFVADGTGVRALYPASQLGADFDAPNLDFGISNISLSPDGRLFALVDLSSNRFTTALYAADGQGHLTLFKDLKSFWPFSTVIAAVTSDYVLAPFDSLYCVTSTAMSALYGPNNAYSWDSYGCSHRAIASEASGFFYYLPGCNGSPILAGRPGGPGVTVLAKLDDLDVNDFVNFSSLAAAPHGGSIANVDRSFFYFDEAGRRIPLTMTPSIAEVRSTENATPEADFSFCAVAVGPTDTIYVVCPSGYVYRATPQP